MGESSREADESLFAVVSGIAISLAESKLVLGVPSPGHKVGMSSHFSLNGNSGEHEGGNESFHINIIII